MKILTWRKDGGPESKVSGFFFIEWKRVFTVVLLKFGEGSRNAYHNHAFSAVSWMLSGRLDEHRLDNPWHADKYEPSFRPIWTPRIRFHKVVSTGTSWVLSFRGPWAKEWREWRPDERRFVTFTHGRREV